MRIIRIILIASLVAALSGCLESSFVLSQDSRIPKWFNVPEGKPRSDFKVTADYYSTFSGGELVFKLYDKKHSFALQTIKIVTKAGSIQLKEPPPGSPKGYPRYKVLTIKGVTDIIEHRKMEPIFYTSDDPAIWKELDPKQ